METSEKQIFFFADFELNAGKRLLLKNGEIVSLNSKSFDLLLTFIKNQGRILSKDELLETVWENRFVEENNLTVQISALRKIFGERKGEHQLIATIPGRGYKFVANVRIADENNTAIDNHAVISRSSQEYSESLSESLIGRKREIEEIKNFLRSNDTNLITLTGTGGSGKTSLAQAVAGEMRRDFPDGVFFVELAAARKKEFVVSAITKTLNITQSSNSPLFENVKEFLRNQRILLILDNFEQVLSAASVVRELLAEVSTLRILITSRAALRLKNEREYLVSPLALPPENINLSLSELAEYPAIELFCKRVQMIKANFVLTSDNFSTISKICRYLDGLPLAIELAAARIKLFSLPAILDRLRSSLTLLTGGANDSPARQRTMRDTIQWSYDLLTEDEKCVFRNIAIFAGGFTVEAAEVIAGISFKKQISDSENSPANFDLPISSASVIDLLSSLIDSSLLIAKEQPDGNVRLWMLEVVREFALESLENSGEAEIIREKHAEFLLMLAEEAETFLEREQSTDWLKKLDIEHDNFRAALQWTFENRLKSAIRLTAALRKFWTNRGYQTEAFKWIETALKKSDELSVTRIKLLNSFSLVARNQGNYELARQTAEESLTVSRKINDLPQVIISCHAIAGLESKEGRFSNAQKFLEESLAISRRLNDKKQISYSLASLGDLFLAQIKLSEARPVIEEALSICRQMDFKINESINLINLGTVDYYEGNIKNAFENFSAALGKAFEIGNKISLSCCLDGLAAVAVMNENPRQAGFLAGMSESLRQSIGYKIEITERRFCENYLGKVCAAIGEKDFAIVYAHGKSLNSDEILSYLANRQHLFGNRNSAAITMNDFYSYEEITEIIVESRRTERIIINEEI